MKMSLFQVPVSGLSYWCPDFVELVSKRIEKNLTVMDCEIIVTFMKNEERSSWWFFRDWKCQITRLVEVGNRPLIAVSWNFNSPHFNLFRKFFNKLNYKFRTSDIVSICRKCSQKYRTNRILNVGQYWQITNPKFTTAPSNSLVIKIREQLIKLINLFYTLFYTLFCTL